MLKRAARAPETSCNGRLVRESALIGRLILIREFDERLGRKKLIEEQLVDYAAAIGARRMAQECRRNPQSRSKACFGDKIRCVGEQKRCIVPELEVHIGNSGLKLANGMFVRQIASFARRDKQALSS